MTSTAPSSPERWIILLFVLTCGFFSVPKVMSTLAPYDDEGYVMLTLQSFRDGDQLYSEIHTQYGPAFYFLNDALHGAFGLPLTHDGVRWKTIAMWTCCSLLCLSILRRFGMGIGWAFLGGIVFHLHLEKLALEPGHPQEWILILGLLSLWTMRGSSPWRWHMAAVYVALIGLIKINCGVLFSLPLILEAIVASVRHPFIPPGSRIPLEAIPRWLSIVFTPKAPWKIVVSTGIATTLLLLIAVRWSGVSWEHLAWGLIGQHQRFGSTFFHAPPVESWQIVAAIGCLILLVWNDIRSDRENQKRAVCGLVLAFFLLMGCALILKDFLRPLQHGLEPRGASAWLLCVVVPILWMNSKYGTMMPSGALYLYGLALTGPWMAYPTPGTQLSLGTSFVWMTAFVVGHSLAPTIPITQEAKIRFQGRWLVLPLAGLVVAGSISWIDWMEKTPLNLRGASWLRLEKGLAERERQIVTAIQESGCRRLVFDGHSHGRFYFWTTLDPLTSANPTFWPRMLEPREQERWLEQLEKASVCVVLPPECEQLAGTNCQRLRDTMVHGWTEREAIEGWRIGVRPPVNRLAEDTEPIQPRGLLIQEKR